MQQFTGVTGFLLSLCRPCSTEPTTEVLLSALGWGCHFSQVCHGVSFDGHKGWFTLASESEAEWESEVEGALRSLGNRKTES